MVFTSGCGSQGLEYRLILSLSPFPLSDFIHLFSFSRTQGCVCSALLQRPHKQLSPCKAVTLLQYSNLDPSKQHSFCCIWIKVLITYLLELEMILNMARNEILSSHIPKHQQHSRTLQGNHLFPLLPSSAIIPCALMGIGI